MSRSLTHRTDEGRREESTRPAQAASTSVQQLSSSSIDPSSSSAANTNSSAAPSSDGSLLKHQWPSQTELAAQVEKLTNLKGQNFQQTTVTTTLARSRTRTVR